MYKSVSEYIMRYVYSSGMLTNRFYFLQLYFMNLRRMSSPVYSVNFDSTHLYGATDQHLVELKYSGYSYKKSNYKEILKYEQIRTNQGDSNWIV